MKLKYITILFCLILFTSCTGGLETVELQVGDKLVTVEIADTQESRARGLMYRKSMDFDHGMLFVFEKEQQMSFWMKDTIIPLSIAYISKSGEIKEIHNMYPLNERAVKSSRSVMYALEMNQGWFEANDIVPGDRIILPENL